MLESWSYIKGSGDFPHKVSEIGDILENNILVTDKVFIYPSIPHKAGLKSLKNAWEKREQKDYPTKKLINMAKFVLKNNFLEFNGSIKQQVSGTAIGTKCSPSCAFIFIDEVETEYLKTQESAPLVWLGYIDNIFFI